MLKESKTSSLPFYYLTTRHKLSTLNLNNTSYSTFVHIKSHKSDANWNKNRKDIEIRFAKYNRILGVRKGTKPEFLTRKKGQEWLLEKNAVEYIEKYSNRYEKASMAPTIKI